MKTGRVAVMVLGLVPVIAIMVGVARLVLAGFGSVSY